MLGLDAKTVRKGSASCHVSPLSDAGIMSTTRTPAGGGGGGAGGGVGCPPGGFWGRPQPATTKVTATRRVVARMATGYTGGGGGFGYTANAFRTPAAYRFPGTTLPSRGNHVACPPTRQRVPEFGS